MWFRFSLRFQLLLTLALALGAEAALSSLWGVRVVPRTLEKAARGEAEGAMDAMVESLVHRCGSRITPGCASPVLDTAAAGILRNVELRPATAAQVTADPSRLRRHVGADQELVATVDLAPSHQVAGRIIQFQLANLILATLVGTLLGSILLNRSVADPVEHLAEVAERIEHLDLAFTDREAAPALGKLSGAFERMSRTLRQEQSRTAKQIADLTRMNEELKEARDTLVQQEKLVTVGRLAAGVAHEVGNPLGGILGYAELLKAAPDPATRDYGERIGLEVERIDGIVRGLLDYSRPRDTSVTAMALAPAVRAAAELCRADRRLKGVELSCQIPDDLPLISADEHRLRQLVVNLLLNAGDAMGGQGRVWVRARVVEAEPGPHRRASDAPAEPRVRLEVEDDGPGIPDELRTRIFDPFFSTKEVGKGTGLGLSICASIMEGFGGELRADRREGGGARFEASFRLASIGAAPLEAAVQAPSAS